jgi:hypothetical protein
MSKHISVATGTQLAGAGVGAGSGWYIIQHEDRSAKVAIDRAAYIVVTGPLDSAGDARDAARRRAAVLRADNFAARVVR